jgi:hypothetical protein
MVELTVFVSQIHFTMTQKASPWLRTTTQLNSNRLVLVQTKQSQARPARLAALVTEDRRHPVVYTSCCLLLTLRFFFKFVSRAYCSKKVSAKWVPQKTKNVALEKFFEKIHPQTSLLLSRRGPDARMRGCLNIKSAQKWHAVIFQISAEKSFPA